MGRVIIAATRGDLIQLKIVKRQHMLGAVNAHMLQIISESHMAMRLEKPRKVIRSDAELAGHRRARDFILIMALQINADAFEQSLRPAH